LLLSSLLLLSKKLNNVFRPGKCLSNKCYTILKLISQWLIICIVYYFWINTFWEILN
jgi:hypothetical protein